MSRIFTDAFEIGLSLWPYTGVGDYSSIGAVNLPGPTQPGVGAIQVRCTETSTRYAYYRNNTILASRSEVYGRVYVQPVTDTRTSGFNRSILWVSNVETLGITNEQVSVFYNENRTISIKVGGTTVCTSTTALAIGTWYLIEFHFKIHSTAGVVELKIDGTTEGTWSGNTDTKSTGVLGYLWIGGNSGSGTSENGYRKIYLDCIAFDDAQWCGSDDLYGSGIPIDDPVDLVSAGLNVGNTSSIIFSDAVERSLNQTSFNCALVRNQSLIQCRTFKTHEYAQGFTDLGNYIDSLLAGDLLIMVVKDQARATQSSTFTTAMANRMKASLYGSIAYRGSYAVASFVDSECLFEEVGNYKIEETLTIDWPSGPAPTVTRRFAQII